MVEFNDGKRWWDGFRHCIRTHYQPKKNVMKRHRTISRFSINCCCILVHHRQELRFAYTHTYVSVVQFWCSSVDWSIYLLRLCRILIIFLFGVGLLSLRFGMLLTVLHKYILFELVCTSTSTTFALLLPWCIFHNGKMHSTRGGKRQIALRFYGFCFS